MASSILQPTIYTIEKREMRTVVRSHPLLPALIRQASALYGWPPSLISRDRSNRPEAVEIRRFIAHGLRRAGWSFPRIGLALGRHHCSIMELLKKEPRFSADVKPVEIRPAAVKAPRLAERQAIALERIADALERLIPSSSVPRERE